MINFNDIPIIIKSLKDAKDIANAIKQLDKEVAVNEKATELFNIIINLQQLVSSLQSDLIIIQSQHHEITQIKNNLEKQLMEKEQWDITASNYELKEIDSAVFVYAPKPNNNGTKFSKEPYHWICTNCYQKRKKSVLQHVRGKGGPLRDMFCPECKTHISVPINKLPKSSE